MYLIAEFREKEAVRTAISTLRAGGVSSEDLDLFSREPVELPHGVLDRPSSMSMVSVMGAIGLGVALTAFVAWSQNNYKLVTGGMPIFSFWATGVITYEMTMLGSILATFVWFLWESGLARRRDKSAPVPKVEPGSICLRVRCAEAEADGASERMRHAGAVSVERRGDR